MLSPHRRSRSSNASRSSSSLGEAYRRGDLKISDPLPLHQSSSSLPRPPPSNMEQYPSPAKQYCTCPPKASFHSGHANSPALRPTESSHLSRVSAGPSLVASTMSTAPSRISILQKKQNGFRATLRRMFGHKRQRSSLGNDRNNLYISDPGNLTTASERQVTPRVTRKLPRSYSSAPQAREVELHDRFIVRRSSEHSKLHSPRRRRRNTIPSVILTDGATPLPEIPKDYRGDRSDGLLDSTEVSFRRRSRSADALFDLASINQKTAESLRDREEEIAYWRTSRFANSVPALRIVQEQEDYQKEDIPSQQNPVGITPIQTFDFGLGYADPSQVTIEQRVNTLEVKVFDFEYALARLQGNNVPKPLLYPKAAKQENDQKPVPEERNHVKDGVFPGYGMTFLSTSDASPVPNIDCGESSLAVGSGSISKPYSSIPQRHTTNSLPPSPADAPLSADRFEKLMSIIESEQKALRQLEAQVTELQREVEGLRTPVFAKIRPLPNPTPSPESFHGNPAAPRALHRTPAFQMGKTAHEISRFSMSDAESENEEEFTDIYGTPREHKHTFEATRGSPLVGVF